MSEYPGQNHFDSKFEAIMSDLESDKNFARAIKDIADQIDQHDVTTLFAAQADTADPRGPYRLMSLEVEMKTLVEGFYSMCDELKIDLTQLNLTPYDLEALYEHMALEVYALGETLRIGDTVSASSALVIHEDVEDGGVSVTYIDDGVRVQGTFLRPFIDSMPDDFNAVASIERQEPPLGLGILVGDPVLIDTDGERDSETLAGQQIIIVLGTLGLKLEKLYYQSDEVFTTPPDDNPDH